MDQARLHQASHVPDALVAVLRVARLGGHVELGDAGLAERRADVEAVVVLGGDHLDLGLRLR